MKLRFIKLAYIAAGLSVSILLTFYVLFDIPSMPKQIQITTQHRQETGQCFESMNSEPLDKQGRVSMLVWNIYKQKRAEWQTELESLSQGAQILLLQEAALSEELIRWLDSSHWKSSFVGAFSFLNRYAGVMTLASEYPQKSCAYTYIEPWLRIPKSGLHTLYPLSNGQTLSIVNLHAINFTFGIQDYKAQLLQLTAALAQHQGPIILAGDFNTWSDERLALVREIAAKLNLLEVAFLPDHRTVFLTGLTVDHIFYRNMQLIKSEASISRASDHNPLLVDFALSEYN